MERMGEVPGIGWIGRLMCWGIVVLVLTGCSEAASVITPLPSETPEISLTAVPTLTPTTQPVDIQIDPTLGGSFYDQVYCQMDDLDLRFDLSYPLSGTASFPLVIYIHGGGWRWGNKQSGAGLMFARPVREAGIAFASIDYRLAPEHLFPAAIQDVKCAIRFFRANAEVLGLDPDRIALLGGSAGGHLAALAGLTGGEGLWAETSQDPAVSDAVTAVVDLFGPTDLRVGLDPAFQEDYRAIFGEAADLEDALWAFSPLAYVTSDDPPFLILHGDADAVVSLSESQALDAALRAEAVPSELIIVAGGGHSSHLFGTNNIPNTNDLIAAVVAFFQQHLLSE